MKILLFEDSKDTAETLSLLFSSKGHETLIATDRDEVLYLARSTSPDAVILDLGLPEKDMRLGVCRLLRSSCRAVIVVLSGWAAATDRVAAFAAGAHHFLLKPAAIFEIENAIKQRRHRPSSL